MEKKRQSAFRNVFRTKEYLGPSIMRGNEGGSGTIVLKEPGVTQYPHHNEKSVFVFLETLVFLI